MMPSIVDLLSTTKVSSSALDVRHLRERNLNGTSEDRRTIAVLGMGKMGQALAGRLLDQGGPSSYGTDPPRISRTRISSAVRLTELDDLWDHASIVITFLANDDALAVLLR